MSNVIEKAGILALEALCIGDYKGRIKPMFSDNDKGVGYDGKIELYNNKSHSRSNFLGHVNVQVKTISYLQSKFEKQDKSQTFKFGKLDSESLDVYQKQGGVLYFVVVVCKQQITNAIIYYKYLLPIDIIKLQQNSQKTYTIELKKVNRDYDVTLFNICINYFFHSKKQSQVLDKKYYLDTKPSDSKITSLSISSLNQKFPSMLDTKFTAEDAYVYEIVDGFYRPIPFLTLEVLPLDTPKSDFNFSYKNISYTMNRVVNHVSETKIEWILDDSISLYISASEKRVESMRINFVDFLNNSLKEKERVIAYISKVSDALRDEKSSFILKAQKILDVDLELHERFGIDPEIKFEHNNNSFNQQFDLVYRIMFEPNLIIKKDKSLLRQFVEFKYGQYTLLGFFDSQTDCVSNVFSEEHTKTKLLISPDDIEVSVDGGVQTFLYLYLALQNSKAIVPYHNFKSTVVIQSFEYHHRTISLEISKYLNEFILYCLKCYDHSKCLEYLKVALHIATKLHELYPHDSNFLLNKAQSEVRIGSLTNETAEKIVHLKEISSTDDFVLLACSIVLKDTHSIRVYKNRIDPEILLNFLEFPIGALDTEAN